MIAPERLLTSKEAAAFLSVHINTLANRRRDGEEPEFIQITKRRVGYNPEVLKKYIEKRSRKSTSDPGRR
jgi:hypothetical protein